MSDNRPGWADQVQEGDFLIAGKNFGTGSSRPGAAVLKNLGLAGMIAESYNGLFYRNCICYGFAAVAAPGILDVFQEGDMAEVDYDRGVVRNLRSGETIASQPLARIMLDIIAAGGIEGVLAAQGYIEQKQEA
jgi:3-isopropylmalate/(R)-2-methylmalate dehydratase small subunit